MEHLIKQVTILDKDSNELANYYPEERFMGDLREYRKKLSMKIFQRS